MINKAKADIFEQVYEDHIENEENNFPVFLDGTDTHLAPYLPTSKRSVIEALSLVNVTSNDTVLDLGSGDGRFVIGAALLFDVAKAVGIEIDSDLAAQSNQIAFQCNIQHKVQFICGDLLEEAKTFEDSLNEPSYSSPFTIVIAFLLPEAEDNAQLRELILSYYHRGARIVAIVFDLANIPGMKLIAHHESTWVYHKG